MPALAEGDETLVRAGSDLRRVLLRRGVEFLSDILVGSGLLREEQGLFEKENECKERNGI